MIRLFRVKAFVVLIGLSAFAAAQEPGADGSGNAAAPADSLAAGGIAADTAQDPGASLKAAAGMGAAQDTVVPAAPPQSSESARMYQYSVSRQRRDAPRQDSAPDTAKTRAEKPVATAIAQPPQTIRADSISILPKDMRQGAGRPAKVKKSGVILAVGTCALIGCGIAAYLLKNSRNDEIIAHNNRIPPPPEPPVNLRP